MGIKDILLKLSSTKWWLPFAPTALLTIIFIALLLVLDRGKYNFQNSTILVAFLPILIWLLVTGKIASFKAFGVELKSAINELSKENIYADNVSLASSTIDYQVVEAGQKVDPSQIQNFIRRGIQALSFQIGLKHYYEANAMTAWMAYDFFKWVVFVDEDGRFKGLMPSDSFRAAGTSGYEPIKQKLENRDIFDLPDFVGLEWALTTKSTKGEAIDKFSNVEVNDLPVIGDADRKFKGVLSRAKLNSKLLAAIFRVARPGH